MKRIILLFALTVICMHGFSQQPNLTVKGRIMEGKKNLKDATIIVYKNNKVVTQFTPTNGKFTMQFTYDESYVLEFSKQGYVSKKLEINTNNITLAANKYGFEYSGFAVKLFKEKEGTDYSNFEDPVVLISYCECVDKFVYRKL